MIGIVNLRGNFSDTVVQMECLRLGMDVYERLAL